MDGKVRVTTLGTNDLKDENSLQQPTHVAPVETQAAAAGNQIELVLGPRSMTVIRATPRVAPTSDRSLKRARPE